MVAACASRNAEKTQVSSANPPSLLTIDGVAVATMLISIAVMNIAIITEAVMIRRPGATAGATAPSITLTPASVSICSDTLHCGNLRIGGTGPYVQSDRG